MSSSGVNPHDSSDGFARFMLAPRRPVLAVSRHKLAFAARSLPYARRLENTFLLRTYLVCSGRWKKPKGMPRLKAAGGLGRR